MVGDWLSGDFADADAPVVAVDFFARGERVEFAIRSGLTVGLAGRVGRSNAGSSTCPTPKRARIATKRREDPELWECPLTEHCCCHRFATEIAAICTVRGRSRGAMLWKTIDMESTERIEWSRCLRSLPADRVLRCSERLGHNFRRVVMVLMLLPPIENCGCP